MKYLLLIVAILLATGCTPYTAEEYAALVAKESKWNGPTGTVCSYSGRGMVCNNSGR